MFRRHESGVLFAGAGCGSVTLGRTHVSTQSRTAAMPDVTS